MTPTLSTALTVAGVLGAIVVVAYCAAAVWFFLRVAVPLWRDVVSEHREFDEQRRKARERMEATRAEIERGSRVQHGARTEDAT